MKKAQQQQPTAQEKLATVAAPASAEINTKIQMIARKLHELKKDSISLEAVRDMYKDKHVDIDELIRVARTDANLEYDEKKELFRPRSRYHIRNAKELLNLLVDTKEGVVEDKDLENGYPGVKEDVELFKSTGAVIELDSNEKNRKVLFGVDKNDVVEEEYGKVTAQALETLRDLWTNLPTAGDEERKKYLDRVGVEISRRSLPSAVQESKKEERKKRRHRKIRDTLLEEVEEEEKKKK